MQRKLLAMLLTFVLCLQALIPSINVKAAETLYNNKVGTQDGYNYELWKDYGTTSMTLNGGGTFSCQWSNIGNALFRKGVKFDNTKTYQQIGNITCNYGCDFKPNGNSYLCVYGWMTSPLVEYYIVESWGDWRPPGAQSKGTITVDGGTYDVYETTRVNQPSIQGDTTFQQYWSVRTSKKTSGTISVSEHFKAWERMGMRCGKLYEAALNVEGYQSSGSANVYKNEFTVGGSGSSNNNNGGNSNGSSNNGSGSVVDESKGTKFECEKMTINGQYANTIDSPFNGVALYGNDESVSFTQNFSSSTNSFTLKGCSNNSNMARVDLLIGGENKGTFYFGDEYPAEYTLENVSHKTGNQKVELVVNADDGNWDAYVDFLYIDGIKSSSNNNSGNTGNNNSGNTGSNNQSQAATGAKTECENMTIGGQYAGKIDSPFNGVALYGNNDVVSYTQNFPSSTNDFTLRGCSNNSNMARVELVIGGENKGTFYFGDEYPAEYTIKNVSHKTGNQKVELIMTADDGNWDAFIDYLTISGISSNNTSNNTNNNTNTNVNNNTSNNNTSNNNTQASSDNKTECEKMTIGGQYAGTVNSPFDGVALYGNNDEVSYTQSFAYDTHDFTLRGCSNNSNMARVDLIIGGENKGTFYFGDEYPAEYTIANVKHKTGNQKIELVVNADDGNWDAFVDYLLIGAAGSTGSSNSSNSNSNANNNNTPSANDKLVCLTFDDGPTTDTTVQILDILEKYNVPATFFMIGQQVNGDTRAIMERQLSLGCELGNHTYTHVDMANMSANDVRNQIQWTSSAIKNTVGYDVKLFRAPYLSTSNTMFQNIDLTFIQGIDSKDYDSNTSVNQRINNVCNNVKDGSIVLMHDFQGNTKTVQALPTIIENLQKQGYKFVTVSDMFKIKGVNPNAKYKVWSNVYDR